MVTAAVSTHPTATATSVSIFLAPLRRHNFLNGEISYRFAASRIAEISGF
jgi:hypothetical protein